MIPETDIDQLLLSFCNGDWRKVAKIIGNTLRALEQRGVQLGGGQIADAIDARMEILVGTRRLEAQGNIRKWRYSEVRLPGASAEAE